jgi:hypothetical protein
MIVRTIPTKKPLLVPEKINLMTQLVALLPPSVLTRRDEPALRSHALRGGGHASGQCAYPRGPVGTVARRPGCAHRHPARYRPNAGRPGVDLSGIVTRATLQRGIAYAIKHRQWELLSRA